jgi:tRNA(Arg) A34 adenosine deaminase TadA
MMQTRPGRSMSHCPRRRWLCGSVAMVALFGTVDRARPSAASEGAASIVQPPAATPAAFARRAFAMKRRAEQEGDQPYGAVVVKAGRIVGEAPSRVITGRDPTAHAEMEAIRDAARRLGARNLADCVLYSSSRPCPMCEAAAYWAGIKRLIHGADATDSGPPRLQRC